MCRYRAEIMISRVIYPLTILACIALHVILHAAGLPPLAAAYAAVFLGAGVVTLCERLLPERREWTPNRATVGNDLAFMLVVQMLLPKLLSLLAALTLIRWLEAHNWAPQNLWVHHWPIGLQAAAMVLLADFFRYWLHVASHRFPLLWRLHAVHHSPHRLYWLNVGRFHPLEKALQFFCDALPFILLGVSAEVVALYFTFYAVNGFFQHCNVRLRLGWLNYLVSGPELHRWHHSRQVSESNANYGNNLIVWDLLFGTWFLPRGREVGSLGLLNPAYPTGFGSQFRAPFVTELDHERVPFSTWREILRNAAIGSLAWLVGWRIYRPIEKSAEDPKSAQLRVLRKILGSHQKTRFGREHGLTGEMSVETFRQSVPITGYDALEPYIQEQEQTGKRSLNPRGPMMFNVTSGTTGKAKFLPVLPETLRAARRNQRLFLYLQRRACPLAFRGAMLGIVSPPVEGYLPSGTPFGSASGWIYRATPWLVRGKFVLPPEVFAIQDYAAKYYAILRLALPRADITYMATANPSTFLRLLDLAAEHREQLVEDVERGSFQPPGEVSDSERRMVLRQCRPNPGRAAELRDAFALTEPNFGAFWPCLRAVSTWTGGSCGVALSSLRAKLPPDVAVMDLGFLASELRATVTFDFDSQAGLPTFWENFFEFVERERWERGEPEFLTLDQLESGADYYLFVTTPSGLFRYPMNDIVQVAGRFQNTPLLRFLQKGVGTTNITGEKLHESQVHAAIREAEGALGFRSRFFQMLADEETSNYRLYLEPDPQTPVDAGALTTKLDENLSARNIEHREKRRSGRLGEPVVALLEPGTAERYKSWCLDQGQREAQFKTVSLRYAREFSFDLAAYAAGNPAGRRLCAWNLRLPFKLAFRHAGATRNATETFWVEAQNGDATGYGEGCPRSYVTGETLESCHAFFPRSSR